MAPIERELFKNIKLRDDYKLLFSDQHLKLIHAYSFGSRGSSTENLQSHPVQNALFKALDLNGVNLTTLTHNKTANTDILTALNTYLFKDKLEYESASDSPPAKQAIDFQFNGVVSANRRFLQNSENFIYSGTDNGFVNLTCSAQLSLPRFKFRLKLHNYYTALETDKISQLDLSGEEKKFLDLPKELNIS
ncbi:hypothetical protein INT48_009319 [Thamnidium elegans]|uniref:Uncharacterized protein n=1 Tax=Thamnidium elegans TaxID=101142 RepID=A0A8H7VXH4_9FUNG|nr:hypothetical protein INT48_009319 [Thamnidium elegans]